MEKLMLRRIETVFNTFCRLTGKIKDKEILTELNNRFSKLFNFEHQIYHLHSIDDQQFWYFDQFRLCQFHIIKDHEKGRKIVIKILKFKDDITSNYYIGTGEIPKYNKKYPVADKDSFMSVPKFIKQYCNPEGVMILEKILINKI
jgi:hypothetical protein